MKKPSGSTDWEAFFKKRPDLEPPGYRETVAKIKANPKRPKC